jgi:ferrous iron transport protein B
MTPVPITVAIVGNPNAGKSTLFNALSGLRQRTGNYPGVTVEMKKGQCHVGETILDLIDLPGTYSLAPRSPDEMVSVNLLLGRQPGEAMPDAIVSVVDASNLERHLFLTSQLLAFGKPVVVAVNMIDVAAAQGVTIDRAKLEAQVGVPVVLLQANAGIGLDELKRAIVVAAGQPPPAMASLLPRAFSLEVELLRPLLPQTPTVLVERLILDIGGTTEAAMISQFGEPLKAKLESARLRLKESGHAVPGVEAKARFGWVRAVTAGAVTRPAAKSVSASDRIDRVLTHRVWGTLVFLAILFVVFQSIFVAATPLMDGIKAGQGWLAERVEAAMPAGPLRALLVDGAIQGVGSVLVFLPQILILFGLIAVLEDCGYMARAAYLMDRVMSRCGLSGKSFIPLLSSVACAVPGILATRVIENLRDRIATMVVAPLMSCSARLPVYTLLIGAFLTAGRPWYVPGLAMFLLYLIGFVTAPIVALILKRTLLRGATPVFVMELPAYKRPSPSIVLRRMIDAGIAFVRRAGTMIFATMVLIWAASYFPGTRPDGTTYEAAVEQAKQAVEAAGDDKDKKETAEAALRNLQREWKETSYLGRAGKALAPLAAPLGWDWKLTTASLASFPAREVIVGTLGILYERDADDEGLGEAIKSDWDSDPLRSTYGVPVACSVLVFFALCCQCVSTLAVIRRETKTWRWPIFTFVYMTALAYVAAWATFRVGVMVVG